MILRAKKEGNYVIFELEGHLDYETTQQFKDKCTGLIDDTDETRLVFNFDKLKFVGSSGISHFVQVMKDINSPKFIKTRPKFCNMSSEFTRIFKVYQTNRNPFDILETETDAIAAFDAPQPAKRTRKKKVTPPEIEQ